MSRGTIFQCSLALAVCFCTISAVPLSDSLQLNGYGIFQAGEIMKGQSLREDLDHAWLQQAIGGMELHYTPDTRTEIRLGFEGSLDFSYFVDESWADLSGYTTKTPNFSFYIRTIEGAYTFGNLDAWPLRLGIGFFEYKYNPDVRNLGEYLFRTRTYPQYIDNAFDFPMQRLLGIRLGSRLFDGALRQEVLLSSEVYRFPLKDYSVTYIAGGALNNILDVSAGIMFDRIFSIDKRFTTYETLRNLIAVKTDLGVDSIPDTTAYYPHSGEKCMMRLSFDPKAFIPWDHFGTEDLKIYAEAAVLGFRDYGWVYDDISKRIPIMLGLNLPVMGVLDVCAIELEQFESTYPNSYEKVYRNGVALPVTDPNDKLYKHDKLRWSLYAKRSLGVFELTGQIARDHMRPTILQVNKLETYDVLAQSRHWWWMLKVQYGF